MFILKKYADDVRGNFSIMFGIGLTLIVTGVAVAIETTNMAKHKSALQAQVDIATLAAALAVPNRKNRNGDYKTVAFDVMVENGFDPKLGKPEVKLHNQFLTVSAQIPYEGYFMKILGDKELNISVNAQSTLPSFDDVEIVMVLDNTFSMTVDGKLTALKSGALNLIDAVKKSDSEAKIGFVPFARYINVGDASGTWLDKPTEYDTPRTWQVAHHSGGTCRTETVETMVDGVPQQNEQEICENRTTTYETKSGIIESRFKGCVGTTDEPHHLAPISSTNRVPGLLDNEVGEVTMLGKDTLTWCPSPLRALDNDYPQMKKYVDALFGTDVTYIPSGLLWGERMLDRTVALKQDPKPEGIRQIMILMTDGQNTSEIRNEPAFQASFEAPPYIYASTSAPVNVPKADADTTLLCDRIKSKKIELYTISFRVDDADAKALVQNCASSPRHAYAAESNQALIDVFEQIGDNLSANVRLTQ
jgi:Flp pilus assembly protein TadG